MESGKLLIRRKPDRDVLQPVDLGGNYRYLWIVCRSTKNAYAYDVSSSWPHTLVATVSLSTMSAALAICYRSVNDSVYVLGANDMGIISNASNPSSSTLTRITGVTINGTSTCAAWAYDYRRDRLYNLDGNNGSIKIVDPQTNSMVTPPGWAEGFGDGSLQYLGDLEKIGSCGGSMFGLWDNLAGTMIFGRVGVSSTAGAKDAAFYDGSLFIACYTSVVKVQVQLSGELNFVAALSTTQITRSICIDRTNNKLVCTANDDGGSKPFHFKFINPTTFTINSSPTISDVSDERHAFSVVWCPYNNKCYAVTRQITGGNPTRLIQADAGTETIDNNMNLPTNLGTNVSNGNLMCFNGIEL